MVCDWINRGVYYSRTIAQPSDNMLLPMTDKEYSNSKRLVLAISYRLQEHSKTLNIDLYGVILQNYL